ncbi:MAG: tRNA-dihydrouridine synthase family protein [Spirochaetes bacterium]|nr:tRNA-dihydrouridine synthase family protein [Spirochaetota bacterium]
MLPESFPYCFAPLDNLSNYVLRRLIASTLPSGTQMAFFSPAINPSSVIYKKINIRENLPVNPGEILYYNLMHGNPDIIAAGMEKMLELKPAGFNLNCGCSRSKIKKRDMPPVGVALMEHPALVADIIKTAKKNFPDVHFSIKIRAGVKHNLAALFDFCRQAEDAGADAIIFHARSAEDQFKRPARHQLFSELKKHVKVPLIGNGDIINDEQAVLIKEKYELGGIMIGRGALFSPGIFRAIACRLNGNPIPHPVMTQSEIKNFLLDFVNIMDNDFGTAVMLRRTRLLARWLCKSLEFGLTLDGNFHKAKTLKDTISFINDFFEKPKRQYREASL